MRTCKKETLHGRCDQPILYGSHQKLTWRTKTGYEEFCYYHHKLDVKLMQPVHEYLTSVQIEVTMAGRVRHDGRPTDAYALEAPVYRAPRIKEGQPV